MSENTGRITIARRDKDKAPVVDIGEFSINFYISTESETRGDACLGVSLASGQAPTRPVPAMSAKERERAVKIIETLRTELGSKYEKGTMGGDKFYAEGYINFPLKGDKNYVESAQVAEVEDDFLAAINARRREIEGLTNQVTIAEVDQVLMGAIAEKNLSPDIAEFIRNQLSPKQHE
jgi:hypothetical protein